MTLTGMYELLCDFPEFKKAIKDYGIEHTIEIIERAIKLLGRYKTVEHRYILVKISSLSTPGENYEFRLPWAVFGK